MILKLQIKLEEYLQDKEESKEEDIEGEDDGELDRNDIYVRQIDYTQDLYGFFFTLNQTEDHKKLSELIGIPRALKNDYKSFLSCLYFLEKDQH